MNPDFQQLKEEIINALSGLKAGEYIEHPVLSRPGATILEATVGKHRWYCERPKYFWTVLDQSFLAKSYEDEGRLLFGIEEPAGVFDASGRFWVREEISGYGLETYFLKNPWRYYEIIIEHTQNIQKIVGLLREVNTTLASEEKLTENLEKMTEVYKLLYRFQSTIFNFFDDTVLHFKEFLTAKLGKAPANRYFANFLQGEMTKEALEKGYITSRGKAEGQTTRGVLYGMGIPPFVFYRHPKFFHEFTEDTEILKMLEDKKLPVEEMQRFLAFRWIVPLGFQVNEEMQYVESSMVSAHLGELMKMVSRKLGKNFEELQQTSIEKTISLLRKART